MKKLFTALLVLTVSSAAFAGEPVYGVSKDLGEALEKAVAAVERAAAVHGTCVSEYPNLDTCREKLGWYECRAVRANHGGSCGKKSSFLDDVIKAANGLSGPGAKAAAAAKLGVK